MTNRKLHTRYQLVPKSITLDDLERPFALKFCFFVGMFVALKPDVRSLATLKLVVNAVGEL